MVDIYLNDEYQIESDQSGKCKLISDDELYIQSIKIEALTQEGDLFYDRAFGWSLIDFVQTEYTDLLEIEIRQRIKSKLSSKPEIDSDSIKVITSYAEDIIAIQIKFKRLSNNQEYTLNISLDRINVEVILND